MNDDYRHLRYWAKTVPESDVGYHPVLYHCLDVAAVGLILLERRPSWLERLAKISGLEIDTVRSLVPLLLSFHDLGKMADGFQHLVPELMARLQGTARQAPYGRTLWKHDTVGYVALEQRLDNDRLGGLIEADRRGTGSFARTWLSAAMGHHGVPPTVDYEAHNPQALRHQFPPEVDADLDAAIAALRALFLPDALAVGGDPETRRRFRAASWLFTGLAVTADWVGSAPHWFPACTEPLCGHDYFNTIALGQAREAVQAAGLIEPKVAARRSFTDLWPGFVPTPLQELTDRLLLSAGPQLILIEEVTGGGKTEAAFTLAHRLVASEQARGVYIGLPTMATANAMYERLDGPHRKLFAADSEPSLVLAHGRRAEHLEMRLDAAARARGSAETEASGECAAWLADHRKKALLADVGIGTIDQALLGILTARHQSLRLSGLAGKVLVVDEVHAADSYMRRLLERLLEAHATLGGSAILLSATLTLDQRQHLLDAFARGAGFVITEAADDSYPALTHLGPAGVAIHALEARKEASRNLGVRLLTGPSDVERLLRETLDADGCACWIRNTVADAIEAWEDWQSVLGAGHVHLFHARFAAGDRAEIERRILGRFGKNSGPDERAGHLLIATQVVEQSLDLDFDCMVTDLAPADLLIQRAGRLRRHRRDAAGSRIEAPDQRGTPTLHVFSPEPQAECEKTWFSDPFPGAACVYEDHGRLWLGARWFADRGHVEIPGDLRPLIEQVYAIDAIDRIPEALHDRTLTAEGDDMADRSIARGNEIKLESGYAPNKGDSTWRDDISTPTRLSDPTTTIRLAREHGGRLIPWQREGRYRWQRSEVNVRASLVASEAPEDAVLIEKAKAEMPGKGRFCVVVVLRELADDLWHGKAVDGDATTRHVTYSRRCGLVIEPREGAKR